MDLKKVGISENILAGKLAEALWKTISQLSMTPIKKLSAVNTSTAYSHLHSPIDFFETLQNREDAKKLWKILRKLTYYKKTVHYNA